MAPLGSHSIPVLVTILLACFSCFLITAFSLVPTAPLHDASDTTDFQALLCLKLHLNDNAGVMASWRNDSSQYCQWPGVTCSKSHTSRVTELNLESSNLHGQIPPCIGNLTFLTIIHLPFNLLTGNIPPEIGHLRRLTYLNLTSNGLTGTIPEALSSCSNLQIIDLSNNTIDGEIPSSMNKCSNLQAICLFDNKLQGVIPEGLVFILLKKRNKVKQASDPSCKELKTFTYADIVKATNGFALANLVGSGKYGSVYKGRFEFEEQPVAIKVFKLDQVGAPKCFLAECEALRNTRHRNLVRVITACSTCDPRGHEFKALILEYMANGSLESWLYPKVNKYGLEKPLSLGYRIKIAVDIASALDYLHNYCIPPMVHCDLKPNNILLDDVMGARLGDFGLAKFLQSNSSSKFNSSTSLAGPRGSIGYIAPEYGYGSKVSVEGDVYSYGIIILEMLTGKTPTDQMFSNGLNIRKYVESTFFSHKIGEILDPNIIPNFEEDTENNCDPENHVMTGMLSCVMQLAKLGISCSMETPKDRPAMQDVYAEVIAIKEAFSALRV
uniref:Receptor kinase-like protein Xa21 n=1 Tax=Oryza nivara TaxID=4536 RepID=A0A0E0HSW5_ORYNI